MIRVIPYYHLSYHCFFFANQIRRDGSFEVNNLPPGSYIVDVLNPNYVFEPVRVDINSKGKIRARKLNLLQANVVQQVPYPMRFKPKMPFKYFQVRESWRITDLVFNPMVLMMVLPLLLIMALSKTVNMNDAETQKVSLLWTAINDDHNEKANRSLLPIFRNCKVFRCRNTTESIWRK